MFEKSVLDHGMQWSNESLPMKNHQRACHTENKMLACNNKQMFENVIDTARDTMVDMSSNGHITECFMTNVTESGGKHLAANVVDKKCTQDR